MKLLTLKFFILLVVLFIPNIVDSKELNSLKNLVIYKDKKKISEISFKNEKDKNVSLSNSEFLGYLVRTMQRRNAISAKSSKQFKI